MFYKISFRYYFLTYLLAFVCLQSAPALAQRNKPKDAAPKTPPAQENPIPMRPRVVAEEDDNWQKSYNKVRQAMNIVQGYYVDKPNADKAAEDAIKGLLEELDPHSVYISASEYKKVNEPLLGNFEGIGVQYNLVKDTIVIVSTISGGPSEQVGIMAGDKIVMIEDRIMAGIKLTNDTVMKQLRGPKNTKVHVKIKRNGQKDLLDFTIIRDKIPLYSIEATYMARPNIGYIKLGRFAATTTDEMTDAIFKLQQQGMKDLILDLRGNGGGLLNVAVELSSMLFPSSTLITYTEGRKSRRMDYPAMGFGQMAKGRLVILIDEGSASASEIVSGAVQDWDRGLIIGRRSFGKGLVQKPFMLSDSSYIRLTIAQYFTPSGRCIQRSYDEGKDAYQKELSNRFEKGELTDIHNIHIPDSLAFETRRLKRKVYGGGGILPDIFVPLDTSLSHGYYNEMSRKNVINQFVLNYVNNNRQQLKSRYPDLETFRKNYEFTDDLFKQLYAEATKEGVENKNPADFEKTKPRVQVLLKALVARYLWDTGAYSQIANETNDVYQKAISVLQDGTMELLKISPLE